VRHTCLSVRYPLRLFGVALDHLTGRCDNRFVPRPAAPGPPAPWRSRIVGSGIGSWAATGPSTGDHSVLSIAGSDRVRIQWLRLTTNAACPVAGAVAMIEVGGGSQDVVIRANRIVAAGSDTLGRCGYGRGIMFHGGSTGIMYNLVRDFRIYGISVVDSPSIAIGANSMRGIGTG
jgi:hypothetical protein